MLEDAHREVVRRYKCTLSLTHSLFFNSSNIPNNLERVCGKRIESKRSRKQNEVDCHLCLTFCLRQEKAEDAPDALITLMMMKDDLAKRKKYMYL